MSGATKNGEYYRTLEMVIEKVFEAKNEKDVMFLLYFLGGSQYNYKDLINLADILARRIKVKSKGAK